MLGFVNIIVFSFFLFFFYKKRKKYIYNLVIISVTFAKRVCQDTGIQEIFKEELGEFWKRPNKGNRQESAHFEGYNLLSVFPLIKVMHRLDYDEQLKHLFVNIS